MDEEQSAWPRAAAYWRVWVQQALPWAAEYLRDLVEIFERERWHWLFYSFREDNWEGMDYELSTTPPPEWYW